MPGEESQTMVNQGGDVEEEIEEKLKGDYFLMFLLASLLLIFYVVIMWILKSSDQDRLDRLNKVK